MLPKFIPENIRESLSRIEKPKLYMAAAGGAVLIAGLTVFSVMKPKEATLVDGMQVFSDLALELGQLRSEQFYASSYDWRHFMLTWHSDQYRSFINATDGGLIMPSDMLRQGMQSDFIHRYISLVDAGLRRLPPEDSAALLREFSSILAFALREHGPQTCLAFASSQYEGVPPDLRASYIERREGFRARFHEKIGQASLLTDRRVEVLDLEDDTGFDAVVQEFLTEDQIRFMNGEFDPADVPLGFVCQFEIDILQALITSENPQAFNLRVQRLRSIYDPESGTLDLRQGIITPRSGREMSPDELISLEEERPG